jgi:hypothetical protein
MQRRRQQQRKQMVTLLLLLLMMMMMMMLKEEDMTGLVRSFLFDGALSGCLGPPPLGLRSPHGFGRGPLSPLLARLLREIERFKIISGYTQTTGSRPSVAFSVTTASASYTHAINLRIPPEPRALQFREF